MQQETSLATMHRRHEHEGREKYSLEHKDIEDCGILYHHKHHLDNTGVWSSAGSWNKPEQNNMTIWKK
jgi:hypothetical protein